MTYMIAAYLVIWAVVFVLVFSMMRRQANMQREIAALRDTVGERKARQ